MNVSIAAGDDQCILEISEANGQVKGTYSGILGQDKPVKGTYNDHKLSLSFSGDWPTDGSAAQVTLDGSISGDFGSGNVVIANRGDGTWTAHRAKQAELLPAANGAVVDIGSIGGLANPLTSRKGGLRQALADDVCVCDPGRKAGPADSGTSN